MIAGFTMRYHAGKVQVLLASVEGPAAGALVTRAQHGETGSMAAMMGWLHYRDDLVPLLPGQLSTTGMTDAAFALAVYLQAGIEGLQRLEGEFSLVVWDGRQMRLIGMRDPQGAWPLYRSSDGTNLEVDPILWTT